MKISNYFLLALLVLFLGGIFMIASTTNIRTKIHFNPNIQNSFKGVVLPKFSVIVAEEGAVFDLNFVENKIFNQINYPVKRAKSYEASSFYKVRNDTLFINNKKNVRPYVSYENLQINCNGINSFIGKAGSSVKVTASTAGGLQKYTLDHSKLVFDGDPQQKNNINTIINNQIKIVAKQSEIEFSCAGISIKLDLDLESSCFLMNRDGGGYNIFNEITGTLKNNSRATFLGYNVIRKINLKGDNTSSFYRNINL